MHTIVNTLNRIADNSVFQNFVTFVILGAGVLVGIETVPDWVAAYGSILHFFDNAILFVFTVEIAVKLGAEGRKPANYFKDPWNVFDFLIVVACYLPIGGQHLTLLRLLRLLRVLRLVKALPRLRILVGALLKSIPSMGYVGVLLFLLFYIYAVAAVFIFGHNDPLHFKNIPVAMLSLFSVVTMEGWIDIMDVQRFGCAHHSAYADIKDMCTASDTFPFAAPLYFITFIFIGTMIMLNLFIGVIMNGMEEAQKENEEEDAAELGNERPTLDQDISEIERQIAAITHNLEKVRSRAKELNKKSG